jgi:DNA-binding GntR family transcriptional regulator
MSGAAHSFKSEFLRTFVERGAYYDCSAPEDLDALHKNIDEAAKADAAGDFPLRARKHIEFHRILARMTGNPIMVIVMNGVLDVLQHYIDTIGNYQNAFVLPSRRRFMKHMEEGDVEAAVAEMETSLKRLQRSYLSRAEGDAAAAAAPALPRKRAPRPAAKKAAAT